jgi:hypothetical protein
MHFAGEFILVYIPPIIYTVMAFKRAKIELRGGGPTTIDSEWTMLFGTAMGLSYTFISVGLWCTGCPPSLQFLGHKPLKATHLNPVLLLSSEEKL